MPVPPLRRPAGHRCRCHARPAAPRVAVPVGTVAPDTRARPGTGEPARSPHLAVPGKPMLGTNTRSAPPHRGRRMADQGCDGGPVRATAAATAARRCGRYGAARRRSLSARPCPRTVLPQALTFVRAGKTPMVAGILTRRQTADRRCTTVAPRSATVLARDLLYPDPLRVLRQRIATGPLLALQGEHRLSHGRVVAGLLRGDTPGLVQAVQRLLRVA